MLVFFTQGVGMYFGYMIAGRGSSRTCPSYDKLSDAIQAASPAKELTFAESLGRMFSVSKPQVDPALLQRNDDPVEDVLAAARRAWRPRCWCCSPWRSTTRTPSACPKKGSRRGTDSRFALSRRTRGHSAAHEKSRQRRTCAMLAASFSEAPVRVELTMADLQSDALATWLRRHHGA